MINGLGVLGWGVGGIEAEAVMVGKPVAIALPEVVGIEVTGALPDGVLPTDLVLTITKLLRDMGVVGKFVEFFGPGVDMLSLGDRGMIANMAPEYGATAIFFPVDRLTIDYLRTTGREEDEIALVEAYSRAQRLWRDETTAAPVFETVVTLDLASIRPCIAGPAQPGGPARPRQRQHRLCRPPHPDRRPPDRPGPHASRSPAPTTPCSTAPW